MYLQDWVKRKWVSWHTKVGRLFLVWNSIVRLFHLYTRGSYEIKLNYQTSDFKDQFKGLRRRQISCKDTNQVLLNNSICSILYQYLLKNWEWTVSAEIFHKQNFLVSHTKSEGKKISGRLSCRYAWHTLCKECEWRVQKRWFYWVQ